MSASLVTPDERCWRKRGKCRTGAAEPRGSWRDTRASWPHRKQISSTLWPFDVLASPSLCLARSHALQPEKPPQRSSRSSQISWSLSAQRSSSFQRRHRRPWRATPQGSALPQPPEATNPPQSSRRSVPASIAAVSLSLPSSVRLLGRCQIKLDRCDWLPGRLMRTQRSQERDCSCE